MPVVDGYAATRQIKALSGATPPIIIALTASVFEEKRTQILSAGCDDFVRKPFQTEVLFTKMSEHLGVRYMYEELAKNGNTEHLTGQKDSAEYILDALAELPENLIDELYQAVIQLDAVQITRVNEHIRGYNEPLAKRLDDIVKRFQYDVLLTYFNQEKASKGLRPFEV